jgi:aryl-alcohol dehydrogenase-like predicted oxidoreductase
MEKEKKAKLSAKELRPESMEIINRVDELAKRKQWTMSQVTLAWQLKRVC